MSFIPPAIYSAWKTVAKAETVYVPGVSTSPITLIVMVLVCPTVSVIRELLYLVPNVERNRAFASATVSPLTLTGP